MRLVKVTHYEGDDEFEISEFILKEGTPQEVLPVCKRWALPVYEGLRLIATGEESDKKWMTYSNGLSKMAYWVRLEIYK